MLCNGLPLDLSAHNDTWHEYAQEYLPRTH